MDVGAAFVSNLQASHGVEPGEGSFYYPAHSTEPAAVRLSTLRDVRFDLSIEQSQGAHRAVIGAIGVQRLGPKSRPSALACHRRDGINQGNQLGDVADVGRSDRRDEREAAAFDQEVMLAAGFRAIGRIRAGLVPPKTARTLLLSTITRSQSIRSASLSRSSITLCNVCQTPASVQSRSRRQQVMPQPQPISRGKSSHWMPVRSTKSMPVSALRLSTGLRPGYRWRLALAGGKRGSMICQSPSSRIGRAMRLRPCSETPASLRLAVFSQDRQSLLTNFHLVRRSKGISPCRRRTQYRHSSGLPGVPGHGVKRRPFGLKRAIRLVFYRRLIQKTVAGRRNYLATHVSIQP